MRKFTSILLAVLMLLATALPAFAAVADPTGLDHRFFANGTAITIQDSVPDSGVQQTINGLTTGFSAYIVWDTNKYVGVPANAIVYGAGNTTTNSFSGDTSITMNGGTIASIYGGGRFDGQQVDNAVITMNGGTVDYIMGGGANGGGGGSTESLTDNVVDNATINVTGGTINQVVYGGGQGNSTVHTTEINFGGTAEATEVIGSGSNGNTNSATINIDGGEVDMVSGVNRGTIQDAEINITNGTVGKVSAGALSDSDNTTGTFVSGSAELNISGAATVTNAYLGKGLEDADVILDSAVPVKAAPGETRVSGDDAIIVNGDMTIAAGTTLEIATGDSLNVQEGKTLINNGTLENSGIVAIFGAMENTGAINNSGELTNGGTITNSGTLTNTGTVNNSVSVSPVGGGAPVVTPGSITNTGAITNSGAINNGGTITSDSAVTGTVTGTPVDVEAPAPSPRASRGSGGSASDTVYEITVGNDGRTFTCTGPYSSFVGVKIDGVSLEDKDYTAQSGSTVLTLKQSYLDTLEKGEHTLRMGYIGGYGVTDFTVGASGVTAAAVSVENPDTGAADLVGIVSALAVVALISAAGVSLKK